MNTSSFDFANILFSWNCNAKCPYCIWQKLDTLYASNLSTFPLKNFDLFIEQIKQHNIPEVIFTWTTTDPLLYKYQNEVLDIIDNEVPNIIKSIHTNGFLIPRKITEFNRYSKATLSIPSFSKEIFEIMMGTRQSVPDIIHISNLTDIPLKISRIVDINNNHIKETESFINTLSKARTKRVAFRKLFWDLSSWNSTIEQLESIWAKHVWEYRDNPIYKVGNLEITLWSFDNTESKSINLFSNGAITDTYLLSEASNNTVIQPVNIK